MQRDIVVLRRILILVGIFLVCLLPPMALWCYYLATGYLHSFIYHVEWLTISTSLSIVAIVSAVINPLIRQLFRRHRQIHPAFVMHRRVNEYDNPCSSIPHVVP